MALMAMAVQPAMAQSFPETCDASFHDLIRSRAWMEAQREVEVAQTLITNESVLAYSCISDSVSDAKSITIFSEDLSSVADSFLSGATLTCESMATLANAAQCSDVDQGRYFPSLKDLVSGDIRPNCSNATRDQNWSDADAIVFVPPAPRAVDEGGLDPTNMQREVNLPNECSDSLFILTGLTKTVKEVSRNAAGEREVNETTYTGGTCLAPGCYFNGTQCVSG